MVALGLLSNTCSGHSENNLNFEIKKKNPVITDRDITKLMPLAESLKCLADVGENYITGHLKSSRV